MTCGAVGEGRRDLDSYRGFRVFVVVDGSDVRGYALRGVKSASGTPSEDAFSFAGPTAESVEEGLRQMIDRELGEDKV